MEKRLTRHLACATMATVGFVLQAIGVSTNSWVRVGDTKFGLWEVCMGQQCNYNIPADYRLNVCRGFGVMGVAFAIKCVVMLLLYTSGKKGQRGLCGLMSVNSAFWSCVSCLVCWALFLSLIGPASRIHLSWSVGVYVTGWLVYVLVTVLLFVVTWHPLLEEKFFKKMVDEGTGADMSVTFDNHACDTDV